MAKPVRQQRSFLIKILEKLTRTIKAKVVFFEIFIVVFAAASVGGIVTVFMRQVLTQKAHQFSERILLDLAKSVEFNYISMPATDEAVQSFSGTEGVLYLGYYGYVITGKKPRKVELKFGVPLNRKYLAFLDENVFNKDLKSLRRNPDTVEVRVGRETVPSYEYYMPVFVQAGPQTKKIGHIILRYSQDVVNRTIVSVTNLILIITGVAVLIAISLSFRGANGIVRPIVQLTEIVKQFSAGDMTVRVNIRSSDEVGVLARTFDDMIVSVREKLEMQKYVSNSTVKMIQKSVSADLSTSEKEHHTERKSVTMLFSDIRGFTAMSEKMDASEVVAILNEYLDLQSGIIKRFRGDIDKFVGDEIVALFTGPNMFVNALNAAREIQRTIRDLNKKRELQRKSPVHVGIGIHTGEVIVGSIGSHDRMDFTVVGDNVNLTSRLCGAAGRGEIIVTRAVCEKFRDNKKLFTTLPPITVKGKAKPVEVFRVEY